MSKISAVSQTGIEAVNRNTIQVVILISLLIMALALLQGCGNKGDLYRESDAAAVDGLQQAADKLRNQPADPEESADEDDEDDEDDEEGGKKPVKNNNPDSSRQTTEKADTGN